MPSYGLPLYCPKCPPKRYFGVLKGGSHRTDSVKMARTDVCPNCNAMLVTRKAKDASKPA